MVPANKSFLLIIVVLMTFSISYSQGLFGPRIYTLRYASTKDIKSKDGNTCQKKGTVSICVEPVPNTEYKNPIYTHTFDVVDVMGGLTTATKVIEFFGGTMPFQVTISNQTDHLINLADSRLYFILSSSPDDPISPLPKDSFLDENIDNLPVSLFANKELCYNYPRTNPDGIKQEVHTSVSKIAGQTKVLDFRATEILPRAKASGYVMFPMDQSRVSSGKVACYEIPIKSDAAATTIEKVRFEFDFEVVETFYKENWKDNPDATQGWVQISQDEYNQGKIRPESYKWERKMKKWIKM